MKKIHSGVLLCWHISIIFNYFCLHFAFLLSCDLWICPLTMKAMKKSLSPPVLSLIIVIFCNICINDESNDVYVFILSLFFSFLPPFCHLSTLYKMQTICTNKNCLQKHKILPDQPTWTELTQTSSSNMDIGLNLTLNLLPLLFTQRKIYLILIYLPCNTHCVQT